MYNYNTTRENLMETIDKMISDLNDPDKLKPGSEERSRAVKDLKALLDVANDDRKLEEDLLDKRHSMGKNEEFEEEKIRVEKNKVRGQLAGAVVTTIAILGSTVVTVKAEKEGYILPREVTSLATKLPKLKLW